MLPCKEPVNFIQSRNSTFIYCFIVLDDDVDAAARGDDVFKYLWRRRPRDDFRLLDERQSGRVVDRSRGHVIGHVGIPLEMTPSCQNLAKLCSWRLLNRQRQWLYHSVDCLRNRYETKL